MLTKDKSFYRNFFSLYWILVLQNIIVLFVNLADNIMIGSYSETALAGVAAVNQIQFIFQQIVFGCGSGLVIVGSQYWGQKRTKEIKKLFSGAFIISFSVAVVLFVISTISPDGIIRLFTPSEDIIKQGSDYIKIIKYTFIIFAFTNIILSGLRCVETVKIGFYVSVIALVVNCTVNYALIGGNFGAPELGVRGAAIGTLIARIIELIIVLWYALFKDKKLHLKLIDFITPDRILFTDYCKASLSVIIVSAMFGVSTALQSVILGHMSDSAIAANSVAATLYQTLKVAAIGASSTASVITGKTIGTGNLTKIKEYTRTMQVMFLIIGVVMSVSLFILKIPVLSIYDLTSQTKSLADAFILVLCITGFGTAYQMPCLVGIVQGGGDGKFILKNDFISIWCIVLPLSFLAAFKLGWNPVAVVFCLNADQLFKCAAAAVKVNSYTWIKKLTRDELKA